MACPVIRKFKKSDVEDVYEYGSDEEAVKYLVWDAVKNIEDATASIINYYWSRPGIFAIELEENKKCIGCISLELEPQHEKGNLATC